ncbi:activator-dependent family glycosyltransferase [Dactylosporangium sp. NPDC005572]|uniref:activator-dependent family glycosyltransferase n=1 Tax=Dactylosporangium sp. NPDC005572 TaxID=3156889 RepID=UPI00339E8498
MRVLLCTLPQKTHFLTMAPLAWALRTAGHEVRVASLPQFSATITQAGLTAAPVGRAVDVDRLDTDEEREEFRRGLPRPYHLAEEPTGPVGWADVEEDYENFVTWGFKLHNAPLVTELVAMARHWRPDLVLWEPFTYAGPIAAKACGAAHGRLLFTADVFGVVHERLRRLAPPRRDPLAGYLRTHAEQFGVDYDDDMVSGQFTVDQLPDSLRVGADLHYVPMRYVPYGGPAVVPKWLWTAPERPRVALTMGLSATEHFSGYTFSVADVLSALADLDVEVVATVAATEQERLGTVPDNARVVDYVPLHALAPTCTAVVNHGGFGTLSTVALHGVPQLLLPYHFEGPLLAGRLVAQGAGLALDSGEATGDAVRAGLLRLLGEASFAERAGALRDEIRALSAPNEVADQLEALTAKYRP